MHILFVWAYWQYPQVSLEFLRVMLKRGHKISVLLGNYKNVSREEVFDNDINFYFPQKWDFLSRIIGTPYPVFKNVSSWIKKVNPDIVHVNSHLFLSNYQAVKASSTIGTPSVVTVHGVMAKRGLVLDALQGVYLQTVAKLLFKKASAVICLTKSDAESVVRISGKNVKIFITPNGVDIGLFKSASVKDPNLITWVGRLVPEKGLIYALKAMEKIAKEHSNARLVLIGDGPLRIALMNFVNKLGLTDRVIFVGSVINRVEVARFLSESSIFVFPSLKEGMSLSVLEAMACGLPVVGSNIPGINDVVVHGQNGFLIPPRNSEALADAVLMLLNDENLRRRLGQNARKLMMEEYSWDKIAGKIEEVYNRVIGVEELK